MYGALRSALFTLDPERAHHLALAALAPAQSSAAVRRLVAATSPSPRLAVGALGLDFPAPLGMAAGFDKEACAYNALLALGFGHVELGTVTPKPQAGNEGKRMQRWPQHKAVVNRLGFPGPGLESIVQRLQRTSPIGIVGANIGPNKATSVEKVPDDLRATAAGLAPHVRFLTVNVSSPNTPGLRALQNPDGASRLVQATIDAADSVGNPRPVLLKLHPDASDDALVAVARAAVDAGARGIIATNTTRARPPGTEGAIEGGLSGAPLLERSRKAIAALHHGLGRDTPIIGVGGIFTGADALGHILAGATLVQAYTGFIYRGPRMAQHAHRELLAEMDKRGLDKVTDAVGLGQ
ncbi:MAG: quinone-dependent dihydroorotate dehydrogenase [Thermoplasmatota archaeon]